VLTHGPTTYTWRKAGELQPEHHVCLNVSEPDTKLLEGCEVLQEYWWGWFLQAGWYNRLPGIQFDITPGKHAAYKKTLLIDGLAEMSRVFRWSIERRRCGPGYSVRVKGKALEEMFAANGTVWGDHSIERIPAGWWLQPTRQRRALARGIIDASAYWDWQWRIEGVGPDEHRMQDYLRLFASVGLCVQQVQDDIYIPTWITSLELNSPTPFPRAPDFHTSPGAPLDRIEDLRAALPSRLSHKGPLRRIDRVLSAGESLAPAAVRAAWRSLGKPAPRPIFDTVQVAGAVPSGWRPLYRCHARDVDHSIAINGCVIGDDTR
jgi:hypothetical protein